MQFKDLRIIQTKFFIIPFVEVLLFWGMPDFHLLVYAKTFLMQNEIV